MRVYISTLEIEGALLEGENPLPIFRDLKHHRDVKNNGSLTEKHKHMLGYEAGARYLPYRKQDRYKRARKNILLKTVVLENELLKATFLPEYGGRLYSLEDKANGRDILYKNPVFQPANLAILNAWFSGGIEWNVGQLGHTFTTCSPVFAARLCNAEGESFLRIYEYERCKNVFWHIDFHLPEGSDKLLVYTRIVNDSTESVPMYWWTNIAAAETPEARVFSDADEVIYQDSTVKGFGCHNMPYLPPARDIDHSYPMKIPHSSEYFFQTSDSLKSPWEAVAYEDGRLFFERSTARLRYRKLFCWGNHAGGMHWRDFLAKPGKGNYIEIQGGLAPTQLHGIDMPAGSEWDFTQVIGMTEADTASCHHESWQKARDYVRAHIDDTISEDEINVMHHKLQSYRLMEVNEILSTGSGWGALERLRRQVKKDRQIPQGFSFPEAGIGEPQYPWMILLTEGRFPDTDTKDIPVSWMIQDEWRELLSESLEGSEGNNWNALLHYGVMLLETGRAEEALAAWENSIKISPSAWAYRNIAEAMRQKEELSAACLYMEKAGQVEGGFPDVAFVQEYLGLLIQNAEFQKAWEVYESLPTAFAENERVRIIIGTAALELEKDDFLEDLFHTELSGIREGEVSLMELWYRYHAGKLAQKRNVKMSGEIFMEAAEKYPLPRVIDFMTSPGQLYDYYRRIQNE